MAIKKYDAEKAIDPGQEVNGQDQGKSEDEINYRKFVDELPEEFRDEIEVALAALLSYVHSDEGTTAIIDDLQKAKGNEAAQVGISSLQAMDAADPEHQWSESSKVFCGYFAVSEIALIAREAGIVDIPKDQEEKIYQQAAQNYIHALIKNKPTLEEREAEAIRIQKEVDPLLTDKMRNAGISVAKERGIPHEDKPSKGQKGQPANKGGLLE